MARSARPIEIVGDVGYVPLTKGKTALIDAADVPLVSDGRWTADPRGRVCYAQRQLVDPATGRRRLQTLHRFLTGAPPGMVVDHINGDGLDNRRANLRVCTQAVNQRNRYYHRDPSLAHDANHPIGASGHRGVYVMPDGRCVARMMVDGRQVDICKGQEPGAVGEVRLWFASQVNRPAPMTDADLGALAREIIERGDILANAAMVLLRYAAGFASAKSSRRLALETCRSPALLKEPA